MAIRLANVSGGLNAVSSMQQPPAVLLKRSGFGSRSILGGERQGARLSSLPDDVLLLIISYIGVDDIVALRKTSKRFSSVTKLRWVWSDALKHHILDKSIPLPTPIADIPLLTAKELEICALHAARFHGNWCSDHPRPRRCVEFQIHKSEDEDAPPQVEPEGLSRAHPHAVSQVIFLPGRNGELLITVSGMNRVVCWEVPLRGSEAFVVAERTLPFGRKLDGLIVNEDPSNEAMLVLAHSMALTRPPSPNGVVSTKTLEAWSLDRFHGRFNVLCKRTNLQGPSAPLYCLRGDRAILSDPIAVWSWRRPENFYRLLSSQPPVPMNDSVLAAKLIRNHVLVVRQGYINLLPVLEFDEDGLPLASTVPLAAGFLPLPRLAKEAIIVEHELAGEERCQWQFNPLTILLRVCEGGREYIRKIDAHPRPEGSVPAEVQGHMGIANLPCMFSVPAQIYPVAPSCANFVVGRNGKGFWLETRNQTNGRSVHAARCFVGFDVKASLVDVVEKDRQPRKEWALDLCTRDKEVYATKVGMGEISTRQYRMVAFAMDDTVGRIVIGGRDGRIQILSFV
ncbi:hypothetical protein EWM64_g3109 [Hericium alpestre]|uniref:F-box domain-containing protein n=1 Tax=Hericium alpestre TaxID=135208 RepID=A0A4Z0A1D0_9AGAM|nr:hypothetical protein EWM64_g3109 [Hericium alpestre]